MIHKVIQQAEAMIDEIYMSSRTEEKLAMRLGLEGLLSNWKLRTKGVNSTREMVNFNT